MKTREELITLLREVLVCSIQEEKISDSILDQIQEAIEEEV